LRQVNEKTLDVEKYSKLLQRAAPTILKPFVRELKRKRKTPIQSTAASKASRVQ
jgi:hypothetical protein